MKRAYLDGLDADESVPMSLREGGGDGEGLPVTKRTVDPGVDVIDLAAMREQLDASRGQRGGG